MRFVVLLLVACESPPATIHDLAVADLAVADLAVAADLTIQDLEAPPDLLPECQWGGAPGSCLASATCSSMPDHTSESGSCPPGQVCCIKTPSVSDNPPVPAGWKLMQQAMVTQAMTNWAVMILHDPTDYPMFSTAMMTFGTQLVMARVEWHPPDFQNNIVHRGVTLYVPA